MARNEDEPAYLYVLKKRISSIFRSLVYINSCKNALTERPFFFSALFSPQERLKIDFWGFMDQARKIEYLGAIDIQGRGHTGTIWFAIGHRTQETQ